MNHVGSQSKLLHLPSSASGMQMARSKKACIIFFDEIDAIGGARFDDGAGGDNEVQARPVVLHWTEVDQC